MGRDADRRLYRFEPLDESGIFLGLGVIQCALLGGGLVGAAVLLTRGVAAPLAALPAALGAGATFGRVGGRAAWEWVPLTFSWGWMRVGRGPRWMARLPLVSREPADAPLPPCLAGLSILEIPWRGRLHVGAVRDTAAQTLTALVPVTGPQFVLASRADQERLVSGWGDVLNHYALERGVVTHLAWSDLARPSGMAEHHAWLAAHAHGDLDPDAMESYAELLSSASACATAHEVLVSITVARDRLARRRASATGDPETALARALATSVDALVRGLSAAGLAPSDPLSVAALRRVLRTRIEPAAAAPRIVGGRLVERLGLVTSASCGPLTVDTAWGHVAVDGAFHRTYWVASWPRLAVPPSWLEPFLSAAGVTRTMTVVLRPVGAHQSRRRIERDLVKLESDAAAKEEKGRRVDARHRRATRALVEREEELVAGYAEMAYVGLVTVSAVSEDELDEHAEIVEQLAREAGMDLRRLDGRQDLAWAATLPLGLAPRTLLA